VKRGQAVLRLKRGHDAARAHPWIFKADVADASDVEPGSAVAVVDAGGPTSRSTPPSSSAGSKPP